MTLPMSILSDLCVTVSLILPKLWMRRCLITFLRVRTVKLRLKKVSVQLNTRRMVYLLPFPLPTVSSPLVKNRL